MTNTQAMWRINSGLSTASLQLQPCVETSYLQATSQTTKKKKKSNINCWASRACILTHAVQLWGILSGQGDGHFRSFFLISRRLAGNKVLILEGKGWNIGHLSSISLVYLNHGQTSYAEIKAGWNLITALQSEFMNCCSAVEGFYFFSHAVVLWQQILI